MRITGSSIDRYVHTVGAVGDLHGPAGTAVGAVDRSVGDVARVVRLIDEAKVPGTITCRFMRFDGEKANYEVR